jgi:uroporphyrinogen decarboxylase
MRWNAHMDGREVVTKAIEFAGPERVPLQFPDMGYSDIEGLPLVPEPDRGRGWNPSAGRSGEDEWGCYWTILPGRVNMGQVTGHPLSDWEKLKDYQFPDPQLPPVDLEGKRRVEGKYLMGGIGLTLFERMHFLRGFQNLLLDLHVNKGRALALADKVLEVQLGLAKQWAERGVDGIGMSDDWGGQDRLFIKPPLWREIFKPRYKRLIDAIHKGGMHAHMHSDGQIAEIIPDWIEVGLDVLNPPSIRALFGIEGFGRAFGGKVCILTGVDDQTTLIRGTREEIVSEAKQLIATLGRFNGGLIAGWADPCDTTSLEVPLKNIKAMYEAFKKYGKYRV